MADFELWVNGAKRTPRFKANVDPADEDECVALLRKTAKAEGFDPDRAVLRTWVGRHRKQAEYRAK